MKVHRQSRPPPNALQVIERWLEWHTMTSTPHQVNHVRRKLFGVLPEDLHRISSAYSANRHLASVLSPIKAERATEL